MNQSFFTEIRLTEANEIRNKYNQIYNESGLSQSISFYKWFYRKIKKPSSGNLLDIACGNAELLSILMSSTDTISCFGTDISFSAMNKVKTRNNNINLCTSVAEFLPYRENCFDVVTIIGSLEHFENLNFALQEIYRVLKINGKVYLLVPNTFSLLTNIWNVGRHGQISIDNQPLQRYGTYKDWENLIINNGFFVKKVYKYERPLPTSVNDSINYLLHPKEIIRLILALIIPINLSWCFLFECEKK